ncbi:HREF motif-containing mRNA splicing related protein [Cryptosporidium ubiquitum]|uniref:HREF motif-containing mRNA splicing related protein n=1 Tax=Cryptosporidium ubiquitum TaxID=857276 RepID=A0A1J4MHA7_9CRYT|nr:HREF motif-containing mRNA splicing related protein [Cryptosporidium ubiquitum]OII73625.1 HREF motif-containing mRNA splicing related protein [Cryptosporidium ubiquitum]
MSGYAVNRYTIESRKVHKSDQRGHLTLKYRRDNTGTKKAESVIKVEREIENSSLSEPVDNIINDSLSSEVNNNNLNIKKGAESDGEFELELEDEGEENELDDDEDLLRELEKIKKERAEKEKEKKNNDIKLMMQNNPLLEEYHENGRDEGDSDKEEYILKKRWTEDTVFRNQNRVSQPKKRFINDILHSDQHRKFMKKYIL